MAVGVSRPFRNCGSMEFGRRGIRSENLVLAALIICRCRGLCMTLGFHFGLEVPWSLSVAFEVHVCGEGSC